MRRRAGRGALSRSSRARGRGQGGRASWRAGERARWSRKPRSAGGRAGGRAGGEAGPRPGDPRRVPSRLEAAGPGWSAGPAASAHPFREKGRRCLLLGIVCPWNVCFFSVLFVRCPWLPPIVVPVVNFTPPPPPPPKNKKIKKTLPRKALGSFAFLFFWMLQNSLRGG